MPTARNCLAGLLTGLILAGSAVGTLAQQPAPITIEKLRADGWEVAGYIAVWENRSLILFQHKEHHWLMQCSVLTDVMRNPRVVTTCYELK